MLVTLVVSLARRFQPSSTKDEVAVKSPTACETRAVLFIRKQKKKEEYMKWRFALGPMFVALCVFVMPIHAQTAEVTTKPAVHLRYDISKEVTLTGTVSSVVKSPTREMKMVSGSHLFVGTKAGTVDASLGLFAMKGQGALSVKPGEHVQMTGVMKTVEGKQVFIARVVQTNGHEYIIRNEHGFAYRPVARTAKSGAKGGQL